MSSKSNNKVVLQCPAGPCASDAISAATDLIVEVRERGISAQHPLDPSIVQVTLTHLASLQQRSPDEVSMGAAGQVLARFASIPQGWHRALAIRSGGAGILTSAARKVQAVRLTSGSDDDVQRVILVLSPQGVAKFTFVTDLDEAPIANMNVIIRHPDGVDRRHATDDLGEMKLPGAIGDVFTVVRIEHGAQFGITATRKES